MENEELVELIQKGINISQNKAILYKQNRGFMYKQAQRYQGLIELDDIMQEMYFVLEKSIKSYDESRGLFISWFGHCIRYYLPRQLSAQYGYRVTAYMIELINRFKKYTAKHVYDTGEAPSDQEIMIALDIPEETLKSIRQAERLLAKESLSLQIGDGITLEDTITDDSDIYAIIDDSIDNDMYASILEDCLSALTEKQRKILKLRMQGLSFAEAGRILGFSRQCIYDAEKNGLKRIRSRMKEKGIYLMMYEDAYKGTLASYKNTLTSTPERIAIKNMTLKTSEAE